MYTCDLRWPRGNKSHMGRSSEHERHVNLPYYVDITCSRIDARIAASGRMSSNPNFINQRIILGKSRSRFSRKTGNVSSSWQRQSLGRYNFKKNSFKWNSATFDSIQNNNGLCLQLTEQLFPKTTRFPLTTLYIANFVIIYTIFLKRMRIIVYRCSFINHFCFGKYWTRCCLLPCW